MACSQILAIRWWSKYLTPIVSKSKSKWYKAQKVQKYALNSKLQALQIDDDEVKNWSLSNFMLAVIKSRI